ncbi:hypothetical protein K5X82_16600 [Halosquirtibacter xylanolyticus]|uniref:hypothetical protein n=1 Tax=Halosquirtibacter xylanolyticus TaxID=3374599 RepID=UPI003748F688|nr:hypothetical protein K5X82_16600 [Prolixibacteraceae bacterium]
MNYRFVLSLLWLLSVLAPNSVKAEIKSYAQSAQDSVEMSNHNLTPDKDGKIYYLRDDISFTITPEWEVLFNQQVAKNAYYFSMGTKDELSSGLITLVWLDYYMDLDVTLESHKKHMIESEKYKWAEVKFSETAYTTFLGRKCRECHYNVISKEGAVNGKIIVFNSAIKTITIFYQSGSSDKTINDLLFKDFKLSFGVRED